MTAIQNILVLAKYKIIINGPTARLDMWYNEMFVRVVALSKGSKNGNQVILL